MKGWHSVSYRQHVLDGPQWWKCVRCCWGHLQANQWWMVHMHTTRGQMEGERTACYKLQIDLFFITLFSRGLYSILLQHSKYQLWSFATHSHAAYQTVSSCPSTATELIGANGDKFSVTKSSENLLHKITVEEECRVSHVTIIWVSHDPPHPSLLPSTPYTQEFHSRCQLWDGIRTRHCRWGKFVLPNCLPVQLDPPSISGLYGS